MNNNKENKYPTLKVIMLYPLLGGIVGGLPVTLMVFIGMLIDQDWSSILEILWVIVAITFLVGFIPLALTGILLACYKVRILDTANYLKAFFIGWLSTFLPTMTLVILANIDALFDWQIMDIMLVLVMSMVAVSIFALLGGLTSVILAKFILPKS